MAIFGRPGKQTHTPVGAFFQDNLYMTAPERLNHSGF